MDKNKVGLYVHIPFCVRKCNYCDFLSFPAGEEDKIDYIRALKEEIRQFDDEKREITSIFFGGGTPSVLDAELIADVMDEIRHTFAVGGDAEITIECNPETLTERKAKTYIKCGINRISFGLQATDNDVLKMLGRIHTYEKFLESFGIARAAGFTNINVDMMAALPGQTLEGYLDGLERVAKLSPEHISAYSLIVEEGTQLCEHLNDYAALPDEDVERQMYHRTFDLLESYGYHRYEISNYAKEGFESRHNKLYWELTDYIGVGLGASGFYRGIRYKNIDDMEKYLRYISAGDESCSELNHAVCGQSDMHNSDNAEDDRLQKCPEIRHNGSNSHIIRNNLMRDITVETRDDMMEEFMFLGLRKMEGISCTEFADIFGCSIESVYDAQIKKNCQDGLIEEYTGHDSSRRLRLTPLGIDISNTVMADFMISASLQTV